jgi:hypothetical protein
MKDTIFLAKVPAKPLCRKYRKEGVNTDAHTLEIQAELEVLVVLMNGSLGGVFGW